MKTYLVTGGAGFIGSNFVLAELSRGFVRIVNLDLLTYAGNPMNLEVIQDNLNYIFVQGDIGDPSLVRDILQKEEAVSCGIVIVEILRGAKNEKDFQLLNQSLKSLPQIPIDDVVIERASKWGFLLERRGKFVPTTDLLIAGAAYKKARILHADSDFELISSIMDLEEEKIE